MVGESVGKGEKGPGTDLVAARETWLGYRVSWP